METQDRAMSAPLKTLAPLRMGDGALTVFGPRSAFTIDDPAGRLMALLELLDGFTPTDEAIARAGFAEDEAEGAVAVIEALVDHHSVVAADRQFMTGHCAGDNPRIDWVRVRVDEPQEPGATSTQDAWHGEPASIQGASVPGSDRRFHPRGTIPLARVKSLLQLACSDDIGSTPSAGRVGPSLHVAVREDDVVHFAQWSQCELDFACRTTEPESRVRRRMEFAFDSVDPIRGSGVCIVVGADLDAYAKQFGNRGYRYALLEAGKTTQRILESATALGLDTLEWGESRDGPLAALFGLRNDEVPLVSVAVGCFQAPGSTACGDADRWTLARDKLTAWQHTTVGAYRLFPSRESVRGAPLGVTVTQCTFPANGGRYGTAGGARTTSAASVVSAIAEGIERAASCRLHVDRTGSAGDLRREGVRLLDIARLTHPDAAIYRQDRRVVPFSDHTAYQWREGKFGSGECTYLPVEMVFHSVTSEAVDRPLCGVSSSSGVAAGWTAPEAKTGALLELIERDAFVRAWRARSAPLRWTQTPRWLLDEMETTWSQLGASVDVVSFPSACVPTVGVAIRSQCHPALVFGMSSSLEGPEAALSKAYDEAVAGHMGAATATMEPDVTAEHVRTPFDHGRFYWNVENCDQVRWFFEGGSGSPSEAVNRQAYEEIRVAAAYFEFVTAGTPLVCFRAASDVLEPIWFGHAWSPAGMADPPHLLA